VICFLIFVGVVGVSLAYLAVEMRFAPEMPDPGTTQAVQDAEACALTQPAPAFTDTQWAELVNGFAAAIDTYRAGGGLPGEHRTTWTREDYRS